MKQSRSPHSIKALFNQQLRIGTATEVTANSISFSLQRAGLHEGVHLYGDRQGIGEVGEYVIVLSESVLVLAKIYKVRTIQSDIKNLEKSALEEQIVPALADANLLGTIDPETLDTEPGILSYPRIGDSVFSAPASFVSMIPTLSKNNDDDSNFTLNLGSIAGSGSLVGISPEAIFSRHCAVLGTTGSGKSCTVARLIEELLQYPSKMMLIDSTGEYIPAFHTETSKVEISRVATHRVSSSSEAAFFPPTSFSESEFFALFSPSAQTQAPVLENAIASLRLIKADPSAGDADGYVNKVENYQQYKQASETNAGNKAINDQYGDFDLEKLAKQIKNECIKSKYNPPSQAPYEFDTKLQGYCESLLMRVRNIIYGGKLPFKDSGGGKPFSDIFNNFIRSNKRLLIVDISTLDAVSMVRPIIVNAIGTLLMQQARSGLFADQPFICLLDEAHNFISKTIGNNDSPTRLDAFESIAREGRKYSLCLCLATQRPRDLSESVLSQIGTLITHRLTNDYDRALVERASGNTNSSITQFLPDLRTGEALVFGTQVPIPLDIQIQRPNKEPRSSSADFQKSWNEQRDNQESHISNANTVSDIGWNPQS